MSAALELLRYVEDVALAEADDAVARAHVVPASEALVGHLQLGESLIGVHLQNGRECSGIE